ncbi:gliding motility-associated C-terminal domain-containing protein [Euzebyella marina]|uniref:Gliding motility-associated C-terminal domain-containing protein n=1 Tax=Euzebyella marina TaxID=1761453 RepID=A0A3G2L9A9_9FLAO|nr:T9SS type B sorting domain-containing protein [Euzebyella marina]AYN68855.1 gliding motility-associated C-terminal domain-containing protein [Euzebyella marina]MAU72072.1 GTP cyclohydrolase [Pseudozobellia sp.]MBG47769.1 GTP cyclohydrolase [Pseudozobellia sp.]|tara:strand:- start:335552 stop:336973 length:1422 start_codon:yes stop_codon:yes gene_type:complete
MRFLLALSLVLLFGLQSQAQNSPDCRSAIPVCADAPIMGRADGGGDIDDFDPEVITETGCLEKGSVSNANIENNTSWYVFRAGTGGQVGFDIEALPLPGETTITAEWDFAVYGPDVACGEISSGQAQPIRCNYEVNGTRYTGIGVNPEDGQAGVPSTTQNLNTYDEWLDVLPGEVYYILINNFSNNTNNDPEEFILTFTGNSVEADQNTALDCTLRDEFLGLDINACEGDPDIELVALNSPAGPDIANVAWSVDFDDDGTIDQPMGSGPTATHLTVSSPNSGRYFVDITTSEGAHYLDDILITFYGTPVLDRVELLNSNLTLDPDRNNIEIFVDGDGDYEYAVNGGEFQDDSVFNDVPPGINTLVINDKNGCGTTEPIEFLVVGYPKFFTPNNDGANDTWNIKGIETLNNPVVFVFDRYGKLLAQLNSNTEWDGTYNGKPLPSSDYWFRFEYEEDEEGVVVAKSTRANFTLKR